MKIKDFIGKEVRLYPNDTYGKNAKLLSFDEKSGYCFEITWANQRADEKEGDIVFYSNSKVVVFRLLREDEK